MDVLFDKSFWEGLIASSQEWIVTELPGLLVLVVAIIIAFRVARLGIARLKERLVRHAVKDPRVDTDEASKRIDTLMGIVHAVIKVGLWVLLVILLLQKFGVNITPILASVGILGLAVGFGAQELVRDFISGFFMLLEN